tara:strand:+ start:382 stop:843 length:462 start_codon:yes stop_codon:yes gene_type:complete
VQYYRAETLGEGAYGSVTTVYDDDGAVFALKKFAEEEDVIDEDEYEEDEDDDRDQPGIDLGTLREISSLRMLSKIRETDTVSAPSVIMPLHDICSFDGSLAMIMPKMKCPLDKAIQGKFLSTKQKIQIAHGLLVATAFLHEVQSALISIFVII